MLHCQIVTLKKGKLLDIPYISSSMKNIIGQVNEQKTVK